MKKIYITRKIPGPGTDLLNEGTRHLIGRRELEMMKSTAIIINTARGPVIDEAALVEALRNHTIAGAGLDVYEHEPQMTAGLTDLDNVVVTPHTGSATAGSRGAMSIMAAETLMAMLSGKAGEQCLNPVVYSENRQEDRS